MTTCLMLELILAIITIPRVAASVSILETEQ